MAAALGDRRAIATRLVLFLALSAVGGGCDLQTKGWAVDSLTPLPGQSRVVLEPWVELSLRYNKGTAFSAIRNLGGARKIMGVVSFAVAVLLLAFVAFSPMTRVEVTALAMIAGGAVGNGYDRLFRAAPGGGTGVVDFVQLNYPWGGSWPAFNVADALLLVGVVIFALCRIAEMRKGPEDEAGEAAVGR